VIFIGELHGTNESPRFVEGVVCSLLRQGKPVTLALEMSSDLQADLDRALVANDIEATRIVEQMSYWGAAMQDGKRSVAYHHLLLETIRWKKGGDDLALLAVDAPSSSNASTRGEMIASKIRVAALDRPRATIIVFTGNLQARKTKGTPWNANFIPAAALLGDLDLVSLNMTYRAGSAWNCGRDGCGVHTVSKIAPTGNATIPKIVLSPTDPNFDGEYYLGEVTASPPLRPNAQQR